MNSPQTSKGDRFNFENTIDRSITMLNDNVWPFLVIGNMKLCATLDKNGAIIGSIEAGKRIARDISRKYYGKNPEEILQALNVQVIQTQSNPHWGSRIQCAEYQHRPPKVTIYTIAIADLVDIAKQYQIEDFANFEKMRDIALSHELYHFLERTFFTRISRQYRIVSYRFGPIFFYKQVNALDEIAAHAFAQELLGLAVNPGILGLLHLFSSEQGRINMVKKSEEISSRFTTC